MMPTNLNAMESAIEGIHEAQHRRHNPVIDVFEALRDYILKFENELDQEHEVGLRLASFGGVVTFHAEKISFTKPNIISFSGTNQEGKKIQLIQHVSQLNFLLQAVKTIEKEKPKRIGFSEISQ